MILIIGGAYQGKLDYALERFNLKESDVFTCKRDGGEPRFDKPVVNNLDEFIYKMTKEGKDARRYLAERRSSWENTILIVNDVNCGLVPMDPVDRAYREAVGRTTVYLGREARSVIRVFCGIPKNLK